MPTYNRGGKSLKVGDIGRLVCLRQHTLLPGETLNASIKGNVRLSALRQQTSVYLHASIEAFASPLRWFISDFPEYLQEGVSTAKTIPTETYAGKWGNDNGATSGLGIGKPTTDFAKFYAQHPVAVFNEWYRWPEDSKVDLNTIPISHYYFTGPAVTNLSSAVTRIHDAPSFDTTEYQVGSATSVDVRELSQIQARFNQAAVQDWTSQDRYQAFMRDIYGAKGSPEHDQVPYRLRSGAELSVTPRDMYATNGPSLGELTSLNNFKVDHKWAPFKAQEHMVVSYFMVLRFSPVFQDGVAPGIYPADTPYSTYQGDPHLIANEQPRAVKAREFMDLGSGTVGYLPNGWEHREGFSHVDETIRLLNNFPLTNTETATAASYRNAANIQNAFRSTALRHWFGDLDFGCMVDSRIPAAGRSIVAGSVGGRVPKGNHPTGGWLK